MMHCMKVRSFVLPLAACTFTTAFAGDDLTFIHSSRQLPVPKVLGANIKVGYTFGNSLTLNDGTTSKRLNGPEIGVEIPAFSLGPTSINFAPSVLLGGQLNHGNDLDGYVYRMMLLGRASAVGATAFYGIGYSYQTPRGGANFDKKGGVEFQVGGAAPLVGGGLELTFHSGSVPAARGYSLSYTLKF